MTDAPDRLPHYVNPAPYDPDAEDPITAEQQRVYLASQWRLMWWKFRRHRLAMVSGGFLLLMSLNSSPVFTSVVIARMIDLAL